MDKKEFMEYTKYLNKTLNVEIPTDKEVLSAWYEPFRNIHLLIAKRMAQLYLQNETGYFKLAKLLEYKSVAMQGRTYNEDNTSKKCHFCGGTGFIQIEREIDMYKQPIEFCARCICVIGNSLPGYIRQVTPNELKSMTRTPNATYVI